VSPNHGLPGQHFTVTYSYPDCSRYPAARYVDVYWVEKTFAYLGSVAFDPQSCAAVSYTATVPATTQHGMYVVWARLSNASKSYIGGDAFPPSDFMVDLPPPPSPSPSPSRSPLALAPTPSDTSGEFVVVRGDDPQSADGSNAGSVKPATKGPKGFNLLAYVPGGALTLAVLAFLLGMGVLAAATILEMRRRGAITWLGRAP
jgi:hypothetical protein